MKQLVLRIFSTKQQKVTAMSTEIGSMTELIVLYIVFVKSIWLNYEACKAWHEVLENTSNSILKIYPLLQVVPSNAHEGRFMWKLEIGESHQIWTYSYAFRQTEQSRKFQYTKFQKIPQSVLPADLISSIKLHENVQLENLSVLMLNILLAHVHQPLSDRGKYLRASNGRLLDPESSNTKPVPLSIGAKAAKQEHTSENYIPSNIWQQQKKIAAQLNLV